MLPPGHFAAGYLTAKAVLHFSHQAFTSSQQSSLILWGTIFGAIPDVDMAYSFFRERGYALIGDEKPNHRRYITHAPVLWFILSLGIYFLSADVYHKYIGLMLLFGTLSHFILDSFDYGIMWLWPLNKKVFSFRNTGKDLTVVHESGNIVVYFCRFLNQYRRWLTFYLEVLIIISALAVSFK